MCVCSVEVADRKWFSASTWFNQYHVVLYASSSILAIILSGSSYFDVGEDEKHWIIILPKTNIAPTNGWLEYYFPIGFRPIFRGENVSFREGKKLLSHVLLSSCFFHTKRKPIALNNSTPPSLPQLQKGMVFKMNFHLKWWIVSREGIAKLPSLKLTWLAGKSTILMVWNPGNMWIFHGYVSLQKGKAWSTSGMKQFDDFCCF